MSVLPRLSYWVASAVLIAPALCAQAAPAAAIQDCSALRSCAAKFCHIENDIAAAQANGNTHREAGLRRALSEARGSCTDESLRKDRLQAVDERKEEVQEREEELAEARAKGKQDKINKAQRKLEEAQADLKDAEDELQR